jgi:hypothetical protein
MKNALSSLKRAVTGEPSDTAEPAQAPKPAAPLHKRRPRFIDAPTVAFAVVCAGRERELVRPNELAELRRIQARNDEIRAQLEKVSHRAARDQIRSARAAYMDDPSGEAFAGLQTPTLDRDDLERHFAGIRLNVKLALRENNAAALASLKSILDRALAMVDVEIPKVRKEEDSVAARYQIESAPGHVTKALHNLAYNLEESIAITLGGTVNTPPRSILAAFGIAHLLDQ